MFHPGTRARTALVVALALIVSGAASAGTIMINRPLLSIPADETEAFLDEQIVRAAAAAQEIYEGLAVGYQGFAMNLPARGASISVDVIAADVDGATMLVFNATARDGRSESLVYRMRWHDALYREIAAMIGFFDAVLGEPLEAGSSEAGSSEAGSSEAGSSKIVFFQDFQAEFIATGDLPTGGVIQPYSLADRDGNLLVASGTFILEVDRFFRERSKIGVDADIPGFWAMHAGSTPAGTIAAASAAQGGIVRLVPGIPQPLRLPTRNSVMNLAIGADGTVFTVDIQQGFMRFGTDGTGPIDLGLPDGTYISFMTTGPENTLLLWEPTQRAILIYDPHGSRVGSIFPHVPFDTALTLKHFEAYPNGDILAVFGDRFVRFARDGSVTWQARVDELPEIGGLGSFTEFHLDPADGTITLLSIQQKRIVQLLDLQALRASRELSDAERLILASNERLRENPYDQQALAERARVYEQIEAWEVAAYAWETAYGINPLDTRIAGAREAVALRRLEENANRLYARTIEMLERLGTSSAAYAYQQAQAEYEKLISRAPENDAARERLAELRRRYEAATDPNRTPPPGRIENVALADIFPSLFTRYQTEPVGTITIRNTGSVAIREPEVTAEMRFLEFPTPGGSAATIEPGATATLDVRLPISTQTLRLQESTPVPVRLTVSYEVGGERVEATEVAVITVHRATALTWEESAKLAAYVTPRDSVVESFAAGFVGTGDAQRYGLSQRLFRAARISDAVGATGLEYIEDPLSGITEVLGDPTVIDTVRFPRTTLRVGYGDCDDTTALLCSLYEAVGIGTAIMTSPGHVFMAFDTGEPEQNSWLFESETTSAIAHGGTVWLPYETTILDQGFLASWEEGSRLYKRYAAAGEIEFLPIAAERTRFPALPLDPASFTITSPPDSIVAPRYRESVASVLETLYTANVARLEQRLGDDRGRGRARVLNQIGILHSRFDEPRAAHRAFESAVSEDVTYAASYINLANLSILEERPDDAITWLDEAESRRPDGVLTTLLRAQAEFMRGDPRAAAEQMTILESRAPDLAAQYPHLSGMAAGRASDARATPMLPWDLE